MGRAVGKQRWADNTVARGESLGSNSVRTEMVAGHRLVSSRICHLTGRESALETLDTLILVTKCQRFSNFICFIDPTELVPTQRVGDTYYSTIQSRIQCLGFFGDLFCFVCFDNSKMDNYLKSRQLGGIFHCANMYFELGLFSHRMHVYINIISKPAGSLESPVSDFSIFPLIAVAYTVTSAK